MPHTTIIELVNRTDMLWAEAGVMKPEDVRHITVDKDSSIIPTTMMSGLKTNYNLVDTQHGLVNCYIKTS